MTVELAHITTAEFTEICQALGLRTFGLSKDTVMAIREADRIMVGYECDFQLWLYGTDIPLLECIKQTLIAAAAQKWAENATQKPQEPEQPSFWA